MSKEILHRRNINSLDDSELSDLRKAFKKIMEFPNDDNRSFAKNAGIHGFPDQECWHGTKDVDGWPDVHLFLPWHRAYLYRLEKDLQDQVPGVTLPYWDWITEPGETEKIPDALSKKTINGETNPLYEFHILYPSAGVDRYTFRTFDQPTNQLNLPSRNIIENIKNRKSFESFSYGIENVHGLIHGWVGGTMGSVPYAAFDPIFWLHHCMVDKIWFDWQEANIIENIPKHYRAMSLSPFEGTVEEYLDTYSLGYDYPEASKEITGGWQ